MIEENMSHENDDKLSAAARKLSTDIRPARDLWPVIAAAIDKPAQRSWMPTFAQAAAVVLLIGASSAVTYEIVKTQQRPIVNIASPDMMFAQTSFGHRYNLGPGFQDARDALAADLEFELQRLSPESRADVETNLQLIYDAIFAMNNALQREPDNLVLQRQLLRAYREELALLRRVSSLSRKLMMRNDI